MSGKFQAVGEDVGDLFVKIHGDYIKLAKFIDDIDGIYNIGASTNSKYMELLWDGANEYTRILIGTNDGSYTPLTKSADRIFVDLEKNDPPARIDTGLLSDILRLTDGDDSGGSMGGHDKIYGRGGNDFLTGSADRDLLNGGSGNDELWGGGGRNSLTGGSGEDLFGFSKRTGEARSTITDFEVKEDSIKLLEIGRDNVSMKQKGDDVILNAKEITIVFEDVTLKQMEDAHFLF